MSRTATVDEGTRLSRSDRLQLNVMLMVCVASGFAYAIWLAIDTAPLLWPFSFVLPTLAQTAVGSAWDGHELRPVLWVGVTIVPASVLLLFFTGGAMIPMGLGMAALALTKSSDTYVRTFVFMLVLPVLAVPGLVLASSR